MPQRFIWLATVVFLAAGWSAGSSPASQSYGKTTKLTNHILVYHGPINVGIVRDGTKALLIDCGEGSVAAALPQLGITAVGEIWFTHHHRDQACGIDNYCMPNRNWLGPGVGFDRCIALIQQLRPTHIFHSHRPLAFDFTDEQLRFMRANLAEQEKLFTELVPWDNPNYGMDEPWARCDPYEQKAEAGKEATIEIVVTNHSSQPRTLRCRPILPRAWDGKGTDPTWSSEALSGQRVGWPTIEVPAKSEGRVRLSLTIPEEAKPGRYVIPIDIRYGRWALPQFTEAIVEL